MNYDDEQRATERRPNSGGGNFDLWFYERRGDRYFLRLTGLGLAVILIPTLLSIVLAVIFYLHSVNKPAPSPNIEINPRPWSTPAGPLIQPAPPSRTPPKIRSGPNPINSNAVATPTPRVNATPTPRGNTNE